MAPPRHHSDRTSHRRALTSIAMLGSLLACSQRDPALSDAANRGRAVYRSFCVQCHHYYDPFQPGSQGPAVAGASLELLEAKILRGTYPEGYTPKDPTSLMPVQPHVKARIPDLHAYLAEVTPADSKPR